MIGTHIGLIWVYLKQTSAIAGTKKTKQVLFLLLFLILTGHILRSELMMKALNKEKNTEKWLIMIAPAIKTK